MKLVLICGMLAGCGMFKKPETFPDQAKAALESPLRIGHLDATLQPVDGHEAAWSPRSDKKLTFSSNIDGQTCIHLTDGRQYLRSHDRLDTLLAEDNAIVARITLVFTARDSLDQVGAWPERAGGVPGALVDHQVSQHSRTRSDDGTTSSTEWLDETFEWCGPTPAVQPTTRYFTVTAFSPDGPPSLFVWAIDGTPASP